MIQPLEPSLMKTFRLDPKGFSVIRNRICIVSAIVFLIILALMAWFLSDYSWESFNFQMIPILTLVPLSLGWGLWSSLRRQRMAWNSFRLEMGETSLRRIQEYRDDIEISHNEITEIRQAPGGGISVMTAEPHRTIFIHEQLVGFDECRTGIARIREIRSVAPSSMRKYLRYGYMLVLLVPVVLVFTSENPWLFFPSAIAVTIILIWGFIAMRRSPNIDTKLKSKAWLYLAPLFFIIVKVYMMLSK
jgi:hypothetical protein